MADRFQLFRLSLLPRPIGDLFDQRSISREEYIRETLSQQRRFFHHGEEFHHVPAAEVHTGSVMLGRIGRSVNVLENDSPDHELKEVTREAWKAAIIVIDPKDHGDGQKVAVQLDAKVGKPHALINRLIDAVNEQNPTGQYDMEVAPLIDTETFWDFASENSGQITRLHFEFVAPNMFGGHDSVSEDLRDYRNGEGAQRVDLTLASKDGLRTETERVRHSVDYIGKGGGVIRARTKAGKHFDSSHRISTTTVDEASTPDEPRLVRAARWLSQILGHE